MADATSAVSPLRRRMIDDMTLATCRRPHNDPIFMPLQSSVGIATAHRKLPLFPSGVRNPGMTPSMFCEGKKSRG